MKILAFLLVCIVLTSVAGEQMLLTLGRKYSHAHATKMASYLGKNSHKLFEQKIALTDYQSIDFEYVGNQVFEYRTNGKMYDVFHVKIEDGFAIMLVKEDTFESGIVAIQKLFKRKLRTTSERIKNQVFNFYFFQNAYQIVDIKAFNAFQFPNKAALLCALNLLLDCPPPESI